jgi:hypothetical protein
VSWSVLLCPGLSCCVLSCPVVSCPVLSCPVLSWFSVFRSRLIVSLSIDLSRSRCFDVANLPVGQISAIGCSFARSLGDHSTSPFSCERSTCLTGSNGRPSFLSQLRAFTASSSEPSAQKREESLRWSPFVRGFSEVAQKDAGLRRRRRKGMPKGIIGATEREML